MSARSLATLQHGVDDVCVEVDALQTFLRSITDELLRNSLLDNFNVEILGKIDSLRQRLEGIVSSTAAQQADLQKLGERLQALQTQSPALSGCRSRTMPSSAAISSSRISEGGDTDAVSRINHACNVQSDAHRLTKFTFVTWNSQKRPSSRSRYVLKDMRQRYGEHIFAFLQEVPRWGVTAYAKLAVRIVEGCDCAIVLPRLTC